METPWLYGRWIPHDETPKVAFVVKELIFTRYKAR
jgi:hypothetical protein